MELSVVVPTLNAREELSGCLDALTGNAPAAEIIVVNGPSADGTTGMVQERDDVAVLIELADRTITTARNAGIDRARGDVVAFVDHTVTVAPEWLSELESGLDGADVVTGPTRALLDVQTSMTEPETRQIAGQEVSYFNPGNVAFTREVLDELDGFDEYLEVGGARDLAHRLARNGFEVTWNDDMQATQEVGTDGGTPETEWGPKYRGLSYRLVKNYNLRPGIVWRLLRHSGTDGYAQLREVFRGENRASQWFSDGRAVITNLGGGIKDGLVARRHDRTSRRNPRGRSARSDRAVTVYDWRSAE